MQISSQAIFNSLFSAKDEDELHSFIIANSEIFKVENWKPLGGNFSNYGVVKNQQSNPVAAIIEKVTNSIDAILTKRCYELGIDPKSDASPQSMEEAIEKFFPNHNWDLQTMRRVQAEDIQLIADGNGPKTTKSYPTSVIVYDNGEGQKPENFESSFLSLLRGNKNDILFVQGKYNMGGSGAIVFCGKKRYQLIASKRFDGGDFGFTLVREHPKTENDHAKETWYEYLTIEGVIPSFSITELDLGLENRKFKTGTIIKMYSYQFPKGYSAFSQDLNQSINEYLYSPALPILTKDTVLRYPNNKVLVTDLYGLRRRLQREEDEYLESKFSLDFNDELFGKMKVSCFVFKTKAKDYDLKRTKEIIQDRYFRNGMAVLFSLNGQVHGHYTSEFITRSLKLNLLKSHLLIHVDCTDMKYEFRKELFMASRDRLKDGEETQQLRWYLATELSRSDGRLAEIEKRRKQAVEIDTSASTQKLLKDFTKSMPIDSELLKLLGQTFKLDIKQDEKSKEKDEKKDRNNQEQDEHPFQPKRFPTFFKLKSKADGQTGVAKILLNGEKTIRFETDAENDYFDRIEEPGQLKIGLLNINDSEIEGGDKKGEPKDITDLFNIATSSPQNGIIKLHLSPKNELKVGDNVKVKISLSNPGNDFEEMLWVKVADNEKPKEKAPKQDESNEPLGLPPLIFAYQKKEDKGADSVSWDDVEQATSMQMEFKTTMVPEAEGDNLKRIFVNMESTVLMNFKSKYKNPNQEQIEIANRKYYTSVYFHTLFLYTITKNRGYEIAQKQDGKNEPEPVDVGTYLKDVFDNYYSSFILNFGGMNEIMQGLGE
jgi:hypothetical protein